MPDKAYFVPGVSCDHCKAAIESAVSRVPGVAHVEVSLENKLVTVSGDGADDDIRRAIDGAGYDIESGG